MADMHMIIAGNIMNCLKKQNKKQTDMAKGIGTTKQTVNKMLNGSRMINAIELKTIVDKLSDMILFHRRVRENGTLMMETWGDN